MGKDERMKGLRIPFFEYDLLLCTCTVTLSVCSSYCTSSPTVVVVVVVVLLLLLLLLLLLFSTQHRLQHVRKETGGDHKNVPAGVAVVLISSGFS
jgi:Flp pilus assembly protein TadB